MKNAKAFWSTLSATLLLATLLSGCSAGSAKLSRFESTLSDAKKGDPVAQFNLGVMYHKGKEIARDLQAALKWYGLAAAQGWPGAEANLGNMYYNGQGVRQDRVEALRLFRSAANKGDGLANAKLAFMYYNGEEGVLPRDFKKAVEWMRKAAEKDVPQAQTALGMMYLEGKGVSQDKKKALRWLRPAALRGQGSAQYRLGQMYDIGDGVSVDKKEAYIWYALAKENGVTRATFRHLFVGILLSEKVKKAAVSELQLRRAEILKRRKSDGRTWRFR